jgi:hypothetical protein
MTAAISSFPSDSFNDRKRLTKGHMDQKPIMSPRHFNPLLSELPSLFLITASFTFHDCSLLPLTAFPQNTSFTV